MNPADKDQLAEVLRLHALWGAGESDGRRAILTGANLTGANLTGAILTGAILTGANLYRANLTWANLTGANLTGANLTGAKLPHFQIPQQGTLTVWKKLSCGVVAKLLVPAKARRTASLVGRKCRAEWAKVLEGEGVSQHDGATRYAPGEIVRPDRYDDDIRVECAPGIHFFLTREEAEEY